MARWLAAIAAVASSAAVACGSGSGGSQPPPPPPQPTATPNTQEPTPLPSPQPQPSPDPTALPEGGVSLEVERLDPAAECQGMVPESLPPMVTLSAPRGAAGSCIGVSADGTGHVAVGVREGEAATWTVFRPDGARAGAFTEPGLETLVRQPEGWHGIARTPLYSPFEAAELVRLTPAGAVASRAPLSAPSGFLVTDLRIAADPAGGSAVLVASAEVAGNHSSAAALGRFDAAGAAVHGSVPFAADSSPILAFLGAGVSRRGEAIATHREPGALTWTWIDRGGAVVGSGSALQVDLAAADPVHLEPLLDGGVAVRFAGEWGAVIPHLAGAASPAPGWLAERRGTELRFARGNRGYAVLPGPGEPLPDCAHVVDLRAPSGRLCGRITIREGTGTCASAPVEQGWDGTLIQLSARDGCAPGACACTAHAWPGLLAAPGEAAGARAERAHH